MSIGAMNKNNYLPREIMIEVEPMCNFNCIFCFNKNSFAKNGRGKIKTFGAPYVKKIIDAIAKSGVKIIRFTGGEPMLRQDLWELMDYAKDRGLKIRLNTNGSLIENKATAVRLSRYVASILLPIQSHDKSKEADMTGFREALPRKIRAIKLLKRYGQMTVRVGTVATKDAIKDLEKMFPLVIGALGADDWEIYRPIPTPDHKFSISKKDVKSLVDKLMAFREKDGRTFNIVNGIPFCAYNKDMVNSVSRGALPVDGHIRYAIDPRGYAKPDYYIDKNIGDPLDIAGCWNHPFMKNMRSLKFVPAECSDCEYLEKCRGGSRFVAKMVFNSFSAKDPLAA